MSLRHLKVEALTKFQTIQITHALGIENLSRMYLIP